MKIYCADTNSFIEGWVRSYPVVSFPGVWEKIEGLIQEKRLITSEEVKRELERKTDSLLEWAKQQDGLFQPTDDAVQEALIKIMGAYPRLVDTKRNKSGADPFVIALAQVRKATVVTQEPYSHTLEKPRIPDVCDTLKVPHVTLLKLIALEGWKF